jgi:hypothetical protein
MAPSFTIRHHAKVAAISMVASSSQAQQQKQHLKTNSETTRTTDPIVKAAIAKALQDMGMEQEKPKLQDHVSITEAIRNATLSKNYSEDNNDADEEKELTEDPAALEPTPFKRQPSEDFFYEPLPLSTMDYDDDMMGVSTPKGVEKKVLHPGASVAAPGGLACALLPEAEDLVDLDDPQVYYQFTPSSLWYAVDDVLRYNSKNLFKDDAVATCAGDDIVDDVAFDPDFDEALDVPFAMDNTDQDAIPCEQSMAAWLAPMGMFRTTSGAKATYWDVLTDPYTIHETEQTRASVSMADSFLRMHPGHPDNLANMRV